MDFGTGRDRQDRSSPELAGTPLYLAPEVLCEGKVPSVSSDIYSLGVLLFYLLTRSYPVRAQGLRALRLAHERRESWDVRSVRPDVPRRLARLIARAIDPVAERRHQSASLLAAELESLSRPPTRLRLAWAAGAAAAIVPLVWLGGEIRARQSERPRVQNAALAVANTFSPAESPVIAVLPLKNLSTEPDSDIFADGLTGEIIRNLAVIRGLEVRSQTSSFAFRDRPRNLREVGDQLGAALVVEGSVLRSGNRLRINAQLVQVAGDVPLWADRFDREFKDIFAIQDEISRAIVNKLRLTLGRGQRRYDTNPEAYEQYLKARALLDRRSEPWKAAALFEQVTAGDPGFAPAYAGLASANAVIAMSPYRGTQGATIPFGDTQRIVMAAAARAVELDPLLAEAHAAMGWVSARSFDWDNADRSFRRAIELDDTLSHVYVNYVESTLHPLERHADAERLLRAALGKDPLSLDVQRELARVLMYRGRYEDAIDGFERVRAADPEFPIHHFGRALMLAGRLPEAIALLETAPGYAPWLGYAYVKAGRRAEAEKLATVHRRFPFRAANIHAALGDTDRAFEALDQMFSTEPQRLAQLLAAPEMGVLHGDPRLTALRKKLRLP
jgi:TolB-like protein